MIISGEDRRPARREYTAVRLSDHRQLRTSTDPPSRRHRGTRGYKTSLSFTYPDITPHKMASRIWAAQESEQLQTHESRVAHVPADRHKFLRYGRAPEGLFARAGGGYLPLPYLWFTSRRRRPRRLHLSASLLCISCQLPCPMHLIYRSA